MYQALTILHNLARWLVLGGILSSIGVAAWRMRRKLPFSQATNALRHWAATAAHIQLLLGMLLYFRSPSLKHYWSQPDLRQGYSELGFFALIHPACMLVAITVLTVGSGLTKREADPQRKYRLMFRWYTAALLIMLLAIPWPFSPLASRPFFRLS